MRNAFGLASFPQETTMPLPSRPFTLAKLNDSVLGAFALVPESQTLDHVVRYLSTWSGSDKLFMVVQYLVKLITPILELRARIQYRAGFRGTPKSAAAEKWASLGSLIGDSRILWRTWGLLPIIQWLIALERTPPPTKYLQTIERLQGLSMLIYYPLEHLYYFTSHSILPSRFSPSPSANAKIAVWSCRAWAAYVVLQFLHLREDWKLLKLRERALRRDSTKTTGDGESSLTSPEHTEVAQRKNAIWDEFMVNVGYLPLTLHWSLQNGLFTSEAWVGIFGTIAALNSFRGGWTATASPLPRTQ
ncbi:peroxisomal biogenesis factor 11 [Gautieria morchelliformis]|nr:peroxisomal biogenesis factor 11 [Gautieria morchelliformis]